MSEEIDVTFDLVCGTRLEKTETEETYELDGLIYYFCSPECKNKFIETPFYYAGSQAA